VLRKIVIMVTGLFLLAAALLPTSPTQAMTTTINIDGEKNWNKTINIIVQSWLKPTTIYRNYYVYKSQPGQWQVYVPQKPAQTTTKPNTSGQLTTPKTPQPPTPTTSNPATANGNTGTNPATTAPTGLTADEQRMVQLVNQERQKAGLQPLQVDMRLVNVARIKAQDMIANGYFSHTSPTYGSPFDMMRSFGITDWRAAAENIAQNPSVDGAHQSFMNSPGHRNNILNPAFNKVGIGIVNGGPYGKTFVQLFIQSY